MSSRAQKMSRRRFLTNSGKAALAVLGTGGLSAASAQPQTSRVIGANDRINVAVIGIRNQGWLHVENFARIENVRVKTLCDIDENLFPERLKQLAALQQTPPATEYDLRRVLDDKDVDAVAIAMPNHWHALASIWACQAGKHVYVEKPCCHNIFEGKMMIEAAKKYDRIVAVGLQNRSIRNIRTAIKFLQQGGIGEIFMARVVCLSNRRPIGKFHDGPAEEDGKEYPLYGYIQGEPRPYSSSYLDKVHYDLWLGPSPKTPFNRNRFHYNWHWHWDYGNGEIGNTSPHQLDLAVWAMGKNDYPARIHSAGGYFGPESSQQTPNVQTSLFEYADGTLIESQVRNVCGNDEAGLRVGNLFYGSKGWMSLGAGKWQTFFGPKNEPGPNSDTAPEYSEPQLVTGSGISAHFENFISALRAGKPHALTCDIQAGFMGSILPQLANISYRLSRELKFDSAKERFESDPEADKMLTRDYRPPYLLPQHV